ncbi:L,D-transpeptidase family protein [Rhodopseudomonas palustris]|uniref:L,D-transpeptidase family protein n=2 Tax=Rhodopseudomonas palustris (strain ATCC BAA-98 / CGA009) TaxID=258594 RepID=A0AAE9Y2N0_RHOPA|nr:L,D-transpeptidase [Rhodopseudomonas palustris]ACF02627.1 ErfK/YbiS/YcfS/YnhG family protein [Rhodopseudomonas palustris TIE-1]OPF95240.1 L,D-transpeptidase [Rhodopseudomonas palustris]PPQ42877.1 L,D-transpeptidase [Rhodopseudomonas palustris]RJF65598.1 L,D-transpeptidase [Rhodopseudomonas palustris]WAB76510.1 L,D-transpeptidase family protein [Rhodopseudomonas palustris]
MMNKRLLTLLASAAVVAAGTSAALAQSYPSTPGAYIGQAGEDRPGLPNFDSIDDEDAPTARQSATLPPPGPVTSPGDPRYGGSAAPVYSNAAPQGPVMSPDDPRYGRPMGAPTYSNAAPAAGPQGPVMSPDDPRYGRPTGATSYSNAAPGAAPQGPVMSPDDPRYGRPMGPPSVIYSDRGDGGVRPPAGVGGGAPSAQPGADGRPMQVSALPPEEQPDADQTVQLPPNLRRQEVDFATKEPAGTIVVDTANTHLYYVLGNGRAIRYGVRVGRDGFTWNGVQKISRKAEWPDWHPPAEMIERQPYLPRFMAGGPGNPMGARAMYLGSTVYRIHGTNQPSTIGKFVSSGCIGMLNDDVSDLFERAKVGTRVVVLPGSPPKNTATAQAQPAMAPGGQSPALPPAPLPGAQPTSVAPLPAPVTIR